MAAIGEQIHPSAITGNVINVAKRMVSNTIPGRFVTGSNSPAYVRLEVSKQPQLNPDEIDWCEIDADPEAGRMPRYRHNVAILAAIRTIYGGIEKKDMLTPGFTKDAIAWMSEGIVKIGTNPDADNLFGGTVIDDESKFALATRLTPDPVEATIGLWLPDREEFIGAKQVSVVRPSLPIAELAADPQYRHLSVV